MKFVKKVNALEKEQTWSKVRNSNHNHEIKLHESKSIPLQLQDFRGMLPHQGMKENYLETAQKFNFFPEVQLTRWKEKKDKRFENIHQLSFSDQEYLKVSMLHKENPFAKSSNGQNYPSIITIKEGYR